MLGNILMSGLCPLFLSSHPQTAQDISFANVQTLFQDLSNRRSCPDAEEPSPQTDRKSVTIKGKWLLTLAGLWLQMTISVSAGENRNSTGKRFRLR